jgi:hypothetical protein
VVEAADGFEKAYEFVTNGTVHPPEDMISIPNHPQLIADLSLLKYQRTETGKIRMEPKEQLRRRGVKSPDFADALCLAFAVDAAEWICEPADPRESVLGQLPRDVWVHQDDDDDLEERERRERWG